MTVGAEQRRVIDEAFGADTPTVIGHHVGVEGKSVSGMGCGADPVSVIDGGTGADDRCVIDGLPGADQRRVIDGLPGAGREAEMGVMDSVADGPYAPPVSRFIDLPTARLHEQAKRWRQLQEARKRYAQWELDPSCPGCRAHLEERAKVLPASGHKEFCLVAAMALAEERALRGLTKALREHPLWPWLSQFPGLGGGHVAFVIGKIGDPRRFPGQRCTEGHYLPAIYPAGSPCPVAATSTEDEYMSGDGDFHADDDADESEAQDICVGTVLPPRPGTGTRALWHWMGLAPGADGRAMRRRKGVQASWDPVVRASNLMPDSGIKDQIVRSKTPIYGDLYRQKKAKLMARVGDETADSPYVIGEDAGRPLRLFEADRIARVYAVKQFWGDLLREWKRIGAGERRVIDEALGAETATVIDEQDGAERCGVIDLHAGAETR